MKAVKFSLNIFASLIFGFGLLAGNIEAQSNEKHSRYSLAISGGASKGAYEAGLNWSVIKILKEYPGLMTAKGYQFFPTEAASITGASAGGINTLLSGMTWCSRPEKQGGIKNRIDDNLFRDIWLRIDINTLLPSRADSPDYLPSDALLSRKDFLDASAELRKQWDEPLFSEGCRIPLGVTVTRIEPDNVSVSNVQVPNQRYYIPFELRVSADNRIKFLFDPADYPKVADPAMILMPGRKESPPFIIDNTLIEDAAFTTSAFPIAFGRKRLQYCRLVIQEIIEQQEQQDQPQDQKRATTISSSEMTCPDGYELAEAEFADGGLFDNLPIGVSRTLAEFNENTKGDPSPVTYIYIDPNRVRYKIPKIDEKLACTSSEPPEACRDMEYSIASESQLLVGFLGTARQYELYRELSSNNWQLNLSEISYKLAAILKQSEVIPDCQKDLPYFDRKLNCAEALIRSGQLLEMAYDRLNPIIDEPYSISNLRKAGFTRNCQNLSSDVDRKIDTACTFDIPRYRRHLADAMLSIVKKAKLEKRKIYNDIRRSRLSIKNDRILRVSSRGAPITGTLLEDFGSFLDYKFREYDYYVGVYDGVIMAAGNLCRLQYSSTYQAKDYRQCFDTVGEQLYTITGLNNDVLGRYIFARLAKREFGEQKLFRFAYESMPDADRDMRIIHDGLAKALRAGESENVFFKHLKTEGFVPTPSKENSKHRLTKFIEKDTKPLLTQIIDDPDSWGYELTRRATTRLVYLETQANKIYAAREPDVKKRETANTGVMGATAFVLQSSTYRYPDISFAPSTAPEDWFWRNVIPYEIGFDFSEGDLLLTWQPTMALSKNDLVGLRGSLGFPGGFFQSSADVTRENYLALGLDYTRLSSSPYISSYGFTPTWYHAFNQPEQLDRDTYGGDIHVGILKNRLRVGIGVRDFDRASDTWFITFGITDIPGMLYWLTR